MYFSHASFHFPSAVGLHKDTSTIPNFEMIHSMSKRLKTSMKELQRCNRSAYLPPQKRKTLKRVFSFVTVEQTGVTPGRAKKVFFPIDMLHFKLCPEEPHRAYLHFASFMGPRSNGLSQVSWSQTQCPYVAFSSEPHLRFSNQGICCFRASKAGAAQKENDFPASLQPGIKQKVALTLERLKNVKTYTKYLRSNAMKTSVQTMESCKFGLHQRLSKPDSKLILLILITTTKLFCSEALDSE